MKNGLCSFSCLTVVEGPWPGNMPVPSGRRNTFCVMEMNRSFQEELARPIDPAKITSPESKLSFIR